MNVFIYWNYKDNDSKKIYKFLGEDDFKNEIAKKNHVELVKKYCDFEMDEEICRKISDSDLLLFFTHGEDDSILKFRYNNELVRNRFVLISSENASLLKGKKIVAICCQSALKLGRYCVGDEIKSRFYIGFEKDLVYSEGESDNLRSVVYKAYSAAFKEMLIAADKKGWTAERFVQMLKKEIRDSLTELILSSENRNLGKYSEVPFYIKTTDALVALGDAKIPLFE